MRKRLMIWSFVVAVVGFSTALVIYFTVGPGGEPDENFQILIVDGQIYRIPLADTKLYRRDLQRFGGNAAVVFDDLSRWFAGLWRGRSLALTVACITAFVSLGLVVLARQEPPDAAGDASPDGPEPG
jgi:hypothetical protein